MRTLTLTIALVFLILASPFAQKPTSSDSIPELDRADSLYTARQYANALQHYSALVSRDPVRNDVSLLSITTRKIALCHMRLKQDSLAFETIDRAIAFSRTSPQTDDLPRMLLTKASFYRQQGLENKALPWIKEALELPSSESMQAELYNTLGLATTNMGFYEDAVAAHLKSLDIRIRTKAGPLSISRTYLNLAGVFDEMKKNEESIRYYRLSEAAKKEAGDSIGLGRVYGNLAVSFKNDRNYEHALRVLDTAFMFSPNPAPEDAYPIYNTYGSIYKHLKQYETSRSYYFRALEAAKASGSIYSMSVAYINIADLYNQQQQYTSAIRYSLHADSLAAISQSPSLNLYINNNLATAYKGLNQPAKALEYLYTTLQLKDSIYRDDLAFAQENMQVKFETAEKDRKLTEQKSILVQQEASLTRNKWIIFSLAMGMLSLFIMGLLYRQSSRSKQKRLQAEAAQLQLKAALAATESERSRIALDIHDGIGQLITGLRLQLHRNDSSGQPEINSTTRLLDELHQEIRNVAYDLMPASLTHSGLIAAFTEYADKISGMAGVKVHFNHSGQVPDVSFNLQVNLYRIVQEWVNNVLKYAGATEINIQLSAGEGDILLTIEDNGQGFEARTLEESKGHGWRNILARSRLLNARPDIDSTPGHTGTLFSIQFPVGQVSELNSYSAELLN